MYKSILVQFDIDRPATPLARAAAGLARRFDARLIGFSAAAVPPPIALPEGVAYDGSIWQVEQSEIEKRFEALKAEFAAVVGGAGNAEWRHAVSEPTRTLATTARVADLIVLAAPHGATNRDIYRMVDTGSLVLQAGRPVLVVADGAEDIPLKRVVIAWKDTREARRAVADALPLLKLAEGVVIVSVDREPDDWLKASVADVAALLATHGVRAETRVIKAKDEIGALAEFMAVPKADVVVSGAYGHSRLREWAFGGVTRSLLDDGSISRLMSG
ncbi:MAG: universal stress protein [Rhizobiales bacterium]|nr:universal stress protein [Hyphomicrobiales bacterium]